MFQFPYDCIFSSITFQSTQQKNIGFLGISPMSEYSLKLTVGDMTIEDATARTKATVEDLFKFALARRKEIKNK